MSFFSFSMMLSPSALIVSHVLVVIARLLALQTLHSDRLQIRYVDRGFQSAGRLERIRNQAGALGALEDTSRQALVCSRRQVQACADTEIRELEQAFHSIQPAYDLALEQDPAQSLRPRHAAKRQHETIRNSGDEKRFRRPLVAGAAKFRRQGGAEDRQPIAENIGIAVRRSHSRHNVVMWQRLHDRSLIALLQPIVPAGAPEESAVLDFRQSNTLFWITLQMPCSVHASPRVFSGALFQDTGR